MQIMVQKNTNRGRPSSNENLALQPNYSGKLAISEVKKEDLLSLCSSLIIPPEFHNYFEWLPTSKTKKDLCMPDILDDEEDMDDE